MVSLKDLESKQSTVLHEFPTTSIAIVRPLPEEGNLHTKGEPVEAPKWSQRGHRGESKSTNYYSDPML